MNNRQNANHTAQVVRFLTAYFSIFEYAFYNVLIEMFANPNIVQYETCLNSNEPQFAALDVFARKIFNQVSDSLFHANHLYTAKREQLRAIIPNDILKKVKIKINNQTSDISNFSILKNLFLQRAELTIKRQRLKARLGNTETVAYWVLSTLTHVITGGLFLPIQINMMIDSIKKHRITKRIGKIDKLIAAYIDVNVADHNDQALINSYIRVEMLRTYILNILSVNPFFTSKRMSETALSCITLFQVNRLSSLPKLPPELLNMIVSQIFKSEFPFISVPKKEKQFIKNIESTHQLLSHGKTITFFQPASLTPNLTTSTQVLCKNTC